MVAPKALLDELVVKDNSRVIEPILLDGIDLDSQRGDSQLERFLNFAVNQGFLLHGSTTLYISHITKGPSKGIYGSSSAAIPLMYSTHTNKGQGDAMVKAVGRSWEPRTLSSEVMLILQFELDRDVFRQRGYSHEDYHCLSAQLSARTLRDEGFVYLVNPEGFQQRDSQFIAQGEIPYKAVFRTKREMFKGTVFAYLKFEGSEEPEYVALISKQGKTFIR